MDFGKYSFVSLILLLAVLACQPALAAANLSSDNLTDILTAKNVASVTNLTMDLQKDPATALYNYAEQSLVTGDFTGAIRLFDQALASNTTMLNKTDALLYLYRDKAYAQIQLTNYTGAIATVDNGLIFYPGDPMLWNNKGWALAQLGKDQDALNAYDRSIALDGNYTNALLNRGNLLNRMGRYSDAAAAFRRANESDPFNVAASDGLDVALKGESDTNRNTAIILALVAVAAAACVIWYIRFRKPAEPAPEEKKKSGKKK